MDYSLIVLFFLFALDVHGSYACMEKTCLKYFKMSLCFQLNMFITSWKLLAVFIFELTILLMLNPDSIKLLNLQKDYRKCAYLLICSIYASDIRSQSWEYHWNCYW